MRTCRRPVLALREGGFEQGWQRGAGRQKRFLSLLWLRQTTTREYFSPAPNPVLSGARFRNIGKPRDSSNPYAVVMIYHAGTNPAAMSGLTGHSKAPWVRDPAATRPAQPRRNPNVARTGRGLVRSHQNLWTPRKVRRSPGTAREPRLPPKPRRCRAGHALPIVRDEFRPAIPRSGGSPAWPVSASSARPHDHAHLKKGPDSRLNSSSPSRFSHLRGSELSHKCPRSREQNCQWAAPPS